MYRDLISRAPDDFNWLTDQQQRIVEEVCRSLYKRADELSSQPPLTAQPDDLDAQGRAVFSPPQSSPQVFVIEGSRGAGKSIVLHVLHAVLRRLGDGRPLPQPFRHVIENLASQPAGSVVNAAHQSGTGYRATAQVGHCLYPEMADGEEISLMEQIFAQINQDLAERRNVAAHPGTAQHRYEATPSPSQPWRLARVTDQAQPLSLGSVMMDRAADPISENPFTQLQDQLNREVLAGWVFAQRFGQTVLSNESLDFHEYVDRRARHGQLAALRREKWHEFVRRYLDAVGRQLLVLIMDDGDLSTTACLDLLRTIRLYLTHPQIVVILGMRLESVQYRLLAHRSPEDLTGVSVLFGALVHAGQVQRQGQNTAGESSTEQDPRYRSIQRLFDDYSETVEVEKAELIQYLGRIISPQGILPVGQLTHDDITRVLMGPISGLQGMPVANMHHDPIAIIDRGKGEYARRARQRMSEILRRYDKTHTMPSKRSLFLWSSRYKDLFLLMNMRDLVVVRNRIDWTTANGTQKEIKEAYNLSNYIINTPTFSAFRPGVPFQELSDTCYMVAIDSSSGQTTAVKNCSIDIYSGESAQKHTTYLDTEYGRVLALFYQLDSLGKRNRQGRKISITSTLQYLSLNEEGDDTIVDRMQKTRRRLPETVTGIPLSARYCIDFMRIVALGHQVKSSYKKKDPYKNSMKEVDYLIKIIFEKMKNLTEKTRNQISEHSNRNEYLELQEDLQKKDMYSFMEVVTSYRDDRAFILHYFVRLLHLYLLVSKIRKINDVPPKDWKLSHSQIIEILKIIDEMDPETEDPLKTVLMRMGAAGIAVASTTTPTDLAGVEPLVNRILYSARIRPEQVALALAEIENAVIVAGQLMVRSQDSPELPSEVARHDISKNKRHWSSDQPAVWVSQLNDDTVFIRRTIEGLDPETQSHDILELAWALERPVRFLFFSGIQSEGPIESLKALCNLVLEKLDASRDAVARNRFCLTDIDFGSWPEGTPSDEMWLEKILSAFDVVRKNLARLVTDMGRPPSNRWRWRHSLDLLTEETGLEKDQLRRILLSAA